MTSGSSESFTDEEESDDIESGSWRPETRISGASTNARSEVSGIPSLGVSHGRQSPTRSSRNIQSSGTGAPSVGNLMGTGPGGSRTSSQQRSHIRQSIPQPQNPGSSVSVSRVSQPVKRGTDAEAPERGLDPTVHQDEPRFVSQVSNLPTVRPSQKMPLPSVAALQNQDEMSVHSQERIVRSRSPSALPRPSAPIDSHGSSGFHRDYRTVHSPREAVKDNVGTQTGGSLQAPMVYTDDAMHTSYAFLSTPHRADPNKLSGGRAGSDPVPYGSWYQRSTVASRDTVFTHTNPDPSGQPRVDLPESPVFTRERSKSPAPQQEYGSKSPAPQPEYGSKSPVPQQEYGSKSPAPQQEYRAQSSIPQQEYRTKLEVPQQEHAPISPSRLRQPNSPPKSPSLLQWDKSITTSHSARTDNSGDTRGEGIKVTKVNLSRRVVHPANAQERELGVQNAIISLSQNCPVEEQEMPSKEVITQFRDEIAFYQRELLRKQESVQFGEADGRFYRAELERWEKKVLDGERINSELETRLQDLTEQNNSLSADRIKLQDELQRSRKLIDEIEHRHMEQTEIWSEQRLSLEKQIIQAENNRTAMEKRITALAEELQRANVRHEEKIQEISQKNTQIAEYEVKSRDMLNSVNEAMHHMEESFKKSEAEKRNVTEDEAIQSQLNLKLEALEMDKKRMLKEEIMYRKHTQQTLAAAASWKEEARNAQKEVVRLQAIAKRDDKDIAFVRKIAEETLESKLGVEECVDQNLFVAQQEELDSLRKELATANMSSYGGFYLDANVIQSAGTGAKDNQVSHCALYDKSTADSYPCDPCSQEYTEMTSAPIERQPPCTWNQTYAGAGPIEERQPTQSTCKWNQALVGVGPIEERQPPQSTCTWNLSHAGAGLIEKRQPPQSACTWNPAHAGEEPIEERQPLQSAAPCRREQFRVEAEERQPRQSASPCPREQIRADAERIQEPRPPRIIAPPRSKQLYTDGKSIEEWQPRQNTAPYPREQLHASAEPIQEPRPPRSIAPYRMEQLHTDGKSMQALQPPKGHRPTPLETHKHADPHAADRFRDSVFSRLERSEGTLRAVNRKYPYGASSTVAIKTIEESRNAAILEQCATTAIAGNIDPYPAAMAARSDMDLSSKRPNAAVTSTDQYNQRTSVTAHINTDQHGAHGAAMPVINVMDPYGLPVSKPHVTSGKARSNMDPCGVPGSAPRKTSMVVRINMDPDGIPVSESRTSCGATRSNMDPHGMPISESCTTSVEARRNIDSYGMPVSEPLVSGVAVRTNMNPYGLPVSKPHVTSVKARSSEGLYGIPVSESHVTHVAVRSNEGQYGMPVSDSHVTGVAIRSNVDPYGMPVIPQQESDLGLLDPVFQRILIQSPRVVEQMAHKAHTSQEFVASGVRVK